MARKRINIRAGFDLAGFSTSGQNMQREFKKTARKMTSIGKEMSMAFTVPFAALSGLSLHIFRDFEQKMANVGAVSNASANDLSLLTEKAKELGRTTRFTSSEVAELMSNYGKLGFAPKEINDIAKATLNLAQASGSDLASSAAIAGSTLRAYGMDATEMARVTDVMALSFSSSALDLGRFANAMPKVAALSNALGISLERTTAILGTVVDNGIEAETAGTMLRNMFLKAKADGFDFNEALEAISNSSDKAKTALQFFDVRAVPIALTMANNIDKINEFTTSLENSGGAAEKMAFMMDNTFDGAIRRMRSALEGTGIAFGEIMAPAISKVTEMIADLSNWFTTLSGTTKKMIIVFGGVLAAIGPIILSIGMAYKGLAIMTTTVNLLTASMNRLFAAIMRNPYTALGAAVAAALVYLVKTQTTLFGVNKEFTKLDEINSQFADTVKENLSNESAGFEVLIMHLKATNAGTKERADLIKKVNNEYGTTISNLTDEKAFLREIDGEYEKIISKMETKIMLEANKERLTALVKERERLMELKKGLEELNDTRKIGDMRAQQAAMQQFQIKYPNFNEDKERLQDVSNELLRVQQNIKGVGAGSIALIKASDGGGGGGDTSAAKAIQSKLADIMFAGQTKLKNIRDEFALTFIKDDEIRGRMQLENAQQNELNALDFAISQLEKKKSLSDDEKAELSLLNSEKVALMELHLRQMAGLEDEQAANRISKAQTDREKQLEIANNLQRKSNLELITNDEEFKAAELEREKNHLEALIKLKEEYGEDVSALQVQLAEKTRSESVSAATTLGQQTGEALSQGIQDMATIGLAAFSKFMGDVLVGGEMTKEDFGRGLLSSLGDFMVQFGTQMVALGVANTALATAISMGPAGGLLAIAAGIALVTAGSALSALSKKGLETSGDGGGTSTGSSGGVTVNGFDNEPIVLETRIEGNELILVQSRSNGFRR